MSVSSDRASTGARDLHASALAFFEESERLLEQLTRDGAERAQQQRQLHTLKGNAATFGLGADFELCHATGSDLGEVVRVSCCWSSFARAERRCAATSAPPPQTSCVGASRSCRS
jgi:HPt (histidine-containing phosphotransfer) domain-containing protein